MSSATDDRQGKLSHI